MFELRSAVLCIGPDNKLNKSHSTLRMIRVKFLFGISMLRIEDMNTEDKSTLLIDTLKYFNNFSPLISRGHNENLNFGIRVLKDYA